MSNPAVPGLQRKPMQSPQRDAAETGGRWLKLVPRDAGNATQRDGCSDLRQQIERLQNEVAALTKKLDAANNDLLWRDTLAARHAEAYAQAEQEAGSPG